MRKGGQRIEAVGEAPWGKLHGAGEGEARGKKDVELAKMLLNEGQMHLLEHGPEPGVYSYRGHVAALILHHHRVVPCLLIQQKKHTVPIVSGKNFEMLVSYIQNAKKLLVDSKAGKNPYDGFTPSTKPPGHGDVHSLLYSSGLLEQWKSEGRKWVLFFQDTNGLLFNAIPSALGVSATKGYNVNSLAVPRKAKEAIGGITKLTHVDGRTMVINVEYNQFDPLLRAAGHPDGDANCEIGYSPYPGNINQVNYTYSKGINFTFTRSTLQKILGLLPNAMNTVLRMACLITFPFWMMANRLLIYCLSLMIWRHM
ncbi:hypothetical protein SETIT_3G168600v2 [Setaria italica]|uniref:Uncharacterized protein n=1 Tax=Setaria italica TaxID=4555 RepID=A0A368QGF2_SETIT|nr:hypothetical protein SETIT_3G168600v2 [Setaria italica]